jgi:hypothetical protein
MTGSLRECRATGDPAYLNDAKAFFGAYQSSVESEMAQNLLVDWNNNYWSTAVLLASLTDLDAYHYEAQQYLASWICSASNVITYTKQGRAWNANKGTPLARPLFGRGHGTCVFSQTSLAES